MGSKIAPAYLQAALQSSALFRAEPASIPRALGSAREFGCAAKGQLHRQGDKGTSVFLLVSGTVKLTQVTPTGGEVIIRHFLPGDSFGLLSVLGMIHDSTAAATQDCGGLQWHADAMGALMNAYPALALGIVGILGRSLHEAQIAVTERSTCTVEQRLALVLLRLMKRTALPPRDGAALVQMPITGLELGEAAGTTMFTASRILRRWGDAGLIGRRWRSMTVLDPVALAIVAGADPDWADYSD